MKGSVAVIAGAVLLALTAGCGDERSVDPGGNGERLRNGAGAAGDRMALVCPTELRASGAWEDWNGIDGYPSPAVVARPFVNEEAGESFVVTKSRYGASAWILRPDETVRAELAMRYEAEYGGWYVTTYETCANESLRLVDGTLPVHQLEHEFGYTLNPPSGSAPTVTEAEAIEAAHRFGLSKDAPLRAAAVRSVYAPGYGNTFDHQDLWVLAFDVMVPKWGYAPPPGLNKPNPLVPGTAVVFVNPKTGKVPRMLTW